MKPVLFVALALVLQSEYLHAGPVKSDAKGESIAILLGSFEIAIPPGWQHSTSNWGQGVTTSIHRPGGTGTLRVRSLSGSRNVNRETLRNITNVDSSISLDWQSWGDLSGYQTDYTENGKFYKQWWLTNQETLLILVYSGESKDDSEIVAIKQMVASLTVVH